MDVVPPLSTIRKTPEHVLSLVSKARAYYNTQNHFNAPRAESSPPRTFSDRYPEHNLGTKRPLDDLP